MKVDLREAILDLLVACWTAWLWKEAAKDLKEPINWDKGECIDPSYTKDILSL
jgi:hypothetical protein